MKQISKLNQLSNIEKGRVMDNIQLIEEMCIDSKFKCKFCGGILIKRCGNDYKHKWKKKIQRFYCYECKREFFLDTKYPKLEMFCKYCTSNNIIRAGVRWINNGIQRRIYKCKRCKRVFCFGDFRRTNETSKKRKNDTTFCGCRVPTFYINKLKEDDIRFTDFVINKLKEMYTLPKTLLSQSANAESLISVKRESADSPNSPHDLSTIKEEANFS